MMRHFHGQSLGVHMELGKLGVWYFTDGISSTDAAAFAKSIENLGYSALWIPETVGRNPFVHASWLLANTQSLILASGIASIYNRDPGASMAAAKTLSEQSGDRFIMGLGVSHQPMVEGVRGHNYGKPVTTMRRYLEQMAKMPFAAVESKNVPPVVVAALGPKMLELSGSLADGAHPYFTTPEHTKSAREILGADALLCVEQKIILESDADKARELARSAVQIYAQLPNYRNNWKRLGFSDDEMGSADRFIDATFAWGDIEQIATRVQAHLDAGATHVCVQPLNPNGILGDPDMNALEELARYMDA